MRRTALALAAASFLIALRQLRQGWGPRPRLRDARWVRAHGADPNPDGQLTALKAWLIRLLGLRRQPLKLQQPSAKPPSTKDDGLTSRERARAHLKFGNICARSCNLEKALKHYASASLIDPTFAAPRYNCAGVCQRLRRFEEAVEHYEAALMLKPHGVEAATNVVVAHMNAGQQAAASGNMSASVAHYSAAVAKCYRALQIQEAAFDAGGRGTQSRFNSEAFANLNIALRLLGKNQEAIDRTWAQLALLARSSLNPSAAPLLAEDERRTTDAVRPPAVELPALSHCLAKSSRAGLRSVSSGPSDILTVVCVKWGDVYGPEYVNRLYAMVRRNLGQGIDADCKPGASSSVSNPLKLRFVCLTDNPVNLRAEVEPLPIPPSAVSWQGWWLKACLFSSNLPIEGRVLYLDLDTVIVGCLDPLLRYSGDFATLSANGFSAEEGVNVGYNSSVMLWVANGGTQASHRLQALHDALTADVMRCLMRWDHWIEMVVPKAHILQTAFPGLVVDYRTHCAGKALPLDASVVCFPRFPKPHQAKEEWVLRHWRE